MTAEAAKLMLSEEGRTKIQEALIKEGFDCGPDGADGDFGLNTALAIKKARAHFNLKYADMAVVDAALLRNLGLLVSDENQQPTIPVGGIDIRDYFLNFITSKINWFAGIMAGVIITFLNTRFGMNLGPSETTAITTLLVVVMTGGVGILRTFFNSPKVATKPPEVVKKVG